MSRHGVKKETYVDADDKTARALTFDLLDGIHEKVCEMREDHEGHLVVCDGRFRKIEARKKRDTAVSALFGFVGGFAAVVSQFFKNLFAGGN